MDNRRLCRKGGGKMLSVCQIKLPVTHTREDLEKKLLSVLRIPREELLFWRIARQSLDARKKPDLFFVYTLEASVKKESKVLKKIRSKNVSLLAAKKFNYLCVQKDSFYRPVIVGSGPAGLFCAYYLVKAGLKPLLLERGEDADSRKKTVEHFWKTGELNQESNVQFGEGGAGTFSDGKLNTGIKDKENRINLVLKTFVENGAKENILYDAKPHVGTDILSVVVKNMRKYIESKGGTFYFDTEMTDFTTENNVLKAVKLSNGEEIETNICVLAIGHSARDTFEMIFNKGINMEQKPFAIGVRVEHPQEKINKSQYGFSDNRLGAASYKLTYKTDNGRGVYSFCMCPGGFVVNAASEKETCVVNGMSYSKRDSRNANSAIVTTVTPQDYPSKHPLAGVEFQRKLERKAFAEGNGNIPIQRLEDFRNNKKTEALGKITPEIKGKYSFGNLNNVLPEYVCKSISDAMEYFERKIEGFNDNDTIMSAVESRTSSPVRIIRDENYQSNVRGLIPAGEGAGYAGGITSAAIDGIKIFEFIGKNFHKPEDFC